VTAQVVTVSREDQPAAADGELVDASTPHSARVYDYWLGGRDNFAVDRKVGDRILRAVPRQLSSESRIGSATDAGAAFIAPSRPRRASSAPTRCPSSCER
jgi:S-adenosyl methyltransferase